MPVSQGQEPLTEAIRVEEQYRLFADAVQSAREFISITDEGNRFTYVNQAFLEAYGYRMDELRGRKPDVLYSEKNPPGLCDTVLRQTLSGSWSGEIMNRRKNGLEFPIWLSTSAIRNDSGKILGLIGVARDISEEKRAAKQTAALSKLGARLSSAIASEEAAGIILETASELLGWDAGYVHLYSPGDDTIFPLATFDTPQEEKAPVTVAPTTLKPTPMTRLVMSEGAQLIQAGHAGPAVVLTPFGNKGRVSASKMYVSIRSAGATIGVISIQSYRLGAYSQEDLEVLQLLADHCGDALKRIDAETKYRSIFEKATEGFFQTTPAGQYRSVNPAMARLMGYSTPEEMISSVKDIATECYVAPAKRVEVVRELQAKGVIENFEFEHYRRDRSKIWVRLNAHVVRDPVGGILCHEGTISDVTERKWAENLLTVQRDFGTFLSSTNDFKAALERLLKIAMETEGVDCAAIYLVDGLTAEMDLLAHAGFSAEFQRRRGNGAPERAVRTQPDSPAGKKASMPEQLGPMERILLTLKSQGLLAIEPIPIQHNGRVVLVLVLGTRSQPEIPARSLRSMEAISAQAGGAIARIWAEQLSSANRELLERTLQSVRAAVFVVDFQSGTIIEANPAATRIFGYSHEAMIGKSAAMLHPDEASYQMFRRTIESVCKQKGFLDAFQSHMKRSDGFVFPSEHTVMPSGDSASLISVVRDISKQKQTEEELHTLSRRIIEAQEVERMRVARELHDGVNQLIASARMRLRNVLSRGEALRPAAREILGRCGQLLVEALEENRRIAHNLRPTDLDVLGFVAACRSFCGEVQNRTGLKIACRISKQIQRLPTSLELNLFRIVQEAVNNAVTHAKASCVTLTMALKADSLVLRIRDDGRGFDPMQKVVRRKRSGLGLSNIRARAVSSGGACQIQSKPGRGATVTVTVPGSRLK